MAARAPLNYETADITRHIQDLVLNSTDLFGFLENLSVFCADELARFSGDVSCGITVLRPSGAPVMGGSDERSRSLEDEQTRDREGPEVIASLEVGIVSVTDLRSEERWPSFVEAARREKVRSLLALRLHLEGQTSAGMIFYSSRPHGFGRDAMAAAHALAAEASKGLRLVLRIVSLQETEENLRAAMASRTPTDLAVGVIIGQERCSYDVALEWLFRAARTRNVSIRDLAAEIVAAADEPHPLRILFDH
jgi:hypothetical protein